MHMLATHEAWDVRAEGGHQTCGHFLEGSLDRAFINLRHVTCPSICLHTHAVLESSTAVCHPYRSVAFLTFFLWLQNTLILLFPASKSPHQIMITTRLTAHSGLSCLGDANLMRGHSFEDVARCLALKFFSFGLHLLL